jgi:hypothetical protein
VRSYASADRQKWIIDRGSLLAVGTFKDYIGRMRRIVRGQETYGGGTPSEQATAYNSRLNADARLSQPQLVSRWSQLVDGADGGRGQAQVAKLLGWATSTASRD